MQLALEVSEISHGAMADYLGVNRATISRWTHNQVPVKRHVLVAWAMVTNVSLEWLETGEYAMRDLNPQPADSVHSRPDLRVLPGGRAAA